MVSTILQLAGFACFAAAAFLLAGVVALLICGGVELLILGLATDQGAQQKVRATAKRAKRK